jgi:hypothetical protein
MNYDMVDADHNPPEFDGSHWDECDPIANVITKLVHVQNRIQSLHNADSCGPSPPDGLLEESYADRDALIADLKAARKLFKKMRADGQY